jgi:hypothetical protein
MPIHPLHRSSLSLVAILLAASDSSLEDLGAAPPRTPDSPLPQEEDPLPAPPKKELRLPRSKRHRQEQKQDRQASAKKKAKRGW